MDSTHPLFHKKLLAIDWGEKFIGLSTYHVGLDPMILAYGRIKGGPFETVWTSLQQIISDEAVDELIVGVPYLTDGKAGSTTKKVEEFLAQLIKVCPLRIHQQDETLSTYEAEQRMKQSPRYNFQINLSEIDAVAATIIMEDFLRSQGIAHL
jgi:putative Holliday junction resolvase